MTPRYVAAAETLGTVTQGLGAAGAERLRHIGLKTWVDIEDLAAAFCIALQVHEGRYPPLPPGAVLASLGRVRESKWASAVHKRLKPAESRPWSFVDPIVVARRALVEAELARRLADGPPFEEVGEEVRV